MPTWLKGSLLLAVAWAAGAGMGVTYERTRNTRHTDVAETTHEALHHLTRELRLDSAQQTAIAEILARRQHDVDSTWNAVRPHVRETVDATAQEIRAVLRADQLEDYRRIIDTSHSGSHR